MAGRKQAPHPMAEVAERLEEIRARLERLSTGDADVPRALPQLHDIHRDLGEVHAELATATRTLDDFHRRLAAWVLSPVSPRDDAERRAALPDVLRRLLALPETGDTVNQLLMAAARLSAEALGPTAHVSVTIGSPLDPDELASTSQLAQRVDGAQVASGQGPCVSAYEEQGVVITDDLAEDPRWPRLGAQLGDLHPSGLSAPIHVGDRLVGSLNVYGGEPFALVPGMLDTAVLLAVALGALCLELELGGEVDRLNEDVRRLVTSRAIIEQAKGVVMAQRHCTADQAFDHLVRISSTRERKLRDVARDIVELATRGG